MFTLKFAFFLTQGHRLQIVFMLGMAINTIAKPIQEIGTIYKASEGTEPCTVHLSNTTAPVERNFCGVKTSKKGNNDMSLDDVRQKLKDVANGLDGLQYLAQDIKQNYLVYLDSLALDMLSHFQILFNLMEQLNNINTTTVKDDKDATKQRGRFIQQTNETICDLSMLLQHPLKGAYSVNISVGDAVSTSVCNHDTESGDYCDYSYVHCMISVVMSVSETVTKELTQEYQKLATTFTASEEHQSENNDYSMYSTLPTTSISHKQQVASTDGFYFVVG